MWEDGPTLLRCEAAVRRVPRDGQCGPAANRLAARVLQFVLDAWRAGAPAVPPYIQAHMETLDKLRSNERNVTGERA